MIKVIAFDYAGVITPGPLTDWARKNLTKEDPKYQIYKQACDQWDMGKMTKGEIFTLISFLTGFPKNKIWEEVYLKQKVNKEMVELIRSLKKNYRIFLFSNFVAEFLRKLLEKEKLLDYFDGLIISSEYKKIKPNFDFFEVLVEKAGVRKDEIIFVDDKKENTTAGNKFGIKSVLFTSAKELERELIDIGVKF